MIEAIVAIEELSHGIGLTSGELLLKDRADLNRFKETTAGKVMICGRKTADTFKYNMNTRGRTLHIVTRNNLIETKDLIMSGEDIIIIGGAQTYKTFEEYIDCWYITWFYKRLSPEENNKLVTYCPSLKEYKLQIETFPKPMMRFSTYKKKWSETSVGKRFL